jgi:bacillithiol biosynthesis deacetylase BshB1
MDREEQLDVIAVGAHPDDVEVGCGGTLASLVKQGYRVGIVDLTDGEPTPLCESVEMRLKEAADAAEILGVHKRITLDLPNRRLFDSFEARVSLAKEFRRYRPKMVLSLGAKTPLASPDHWQAVQITDAAVFYSRLSKWDEYFDGMPTYKVPNLIYYYLSFEFDTCSSNMIVNDISDELETKLKSIRAYRSQFPPEKEYLFERIKGLAISYGSAAGFQAGEAFTSTRVLGTQDLLQAVSSFPVDRSA